MLASVGKLLSNVKSYYNEINSATLTGAIDILVVEQPDGTYQSSPFHVRFGKLGVIRSREKVVYIEINGEPIDLHMKLGPAGEAFFVQEVLDKWEGPDYLATSPIISPLQEAANLHASHSDSALDEQNLSKSKRRRNESELSRSSSSSASDIDTNKNDRAKFSFEPINQVDDEMLESGGMFDIEVSDDESKIPLPDLAHGMSKTVSLPLIQESRHSRTENWARHSYHSSSFHPFSDTDLTPAVSPVGSRPHTPKSDTECEYTDRQSNSLNEPIQKWNWGELPESSQNLLQEVVVQTQPPNKDDRQSTVENTEESTGLWSFMRSTKTIRHKPQEGGIYLADINLQEMDPEVAALYFPKKHNKQDKIDSAHAINIPEEDSESGRGASLPHSPDNLSLDTRNVITPTSDAGTMKENDFGLYGDLAMSLCGGLSEHHNTIPAELFSQHQITYTDFCEKSTEILQNTNLVLRISGKYYNWASAAPMLMSMVIFQQTLPSETQEQLVKLNMPTKKQRGRSWWPFGRQKDPSEIDVNDGSNRSTPNGSLKKSDLVQTSQIQSTRHSESGDEADDEKEKEKSVMEPLTVEVNDPDEGLKKPYAERYVKTLRLTSEQLERLNLHEGENEIEFSVTTAYQGTTRCVAHIYLWKHTDKIIISDIDGTITKSDVLGQILPMVGKDWSQSGVTDLFTKIAQNGYQFAYLSARAIGQAQITRDYLRSVKQGECSLPPGPLFLNPSSLINAFHKEVIEKKPEEFKIRCMSDIKSLFSSPNSLYAGFGNRVNDMYAYRAVGIPKSRMFLIDPSGKLKSDFSQTFESSYSHLSDVADHYFPPIDEVADEITHHSPAEFSNFTFWREPLPDIDISVLV